jgi:uncharacterized Zn-binding protein involved in type VI secretion
MPPAARISDQHMCPQVLPGPVPHVGGPIFTGSMNVIIGYLPAARIRDRAVCMPLGPLDQVSKGAATVLINQRNAARRTDPMNHGGIIVAGCPTVIIGDTPQSFTFRAAAKQGTPFCEECERARKKHEQEAHEQDELEPMTDAATLDDPEPPPGAVTPGALNAEHTLGDLRALAAEPDQNDGNDEWRAEVRGAIAWNFYLDQGGMANKLSKIESHVRGINLTQPIKIVEIPRPAAGRSINMSPRAKHSASTSRSTRASPPMPSACRSWPTRSSTGCSAQWP